MSNEEKVTPANKQNIVFFWLIVTRITEQPLEDKVKQQKEKTK